MMLEFWEQSMVVCMLVLCGATRASCMHQTDLWDTIVDFLIYSTSQRMCFRSWVDNNCDVMEFGETLYVHRWVEHY